MVGTSTTPVIPTGLHELLGLAAPDGTAPGGQWTPAMAVLTDAMARWAAGNDAHHTGGQQGIAWIGRTVRPQPEALPQHVNNTPLDLPARSLIVTPHGRTSRFWAIERALRCPSIGCIVADGSGADHIITRRIQLLATQRRTLVLLARPATERSEPSSAQSRWLVRRTPTTDMYPCWQVELLRTRFASDRVAGECWTHATDTPLPLREGTLHWSPRRTLQMHQHV